MQAACLNVYELWIQMIKSSTGNRESIVKSGNFRERYRERLRKKI
jgi:hypothetical protein